MTIDEFNDKYDEYLEPGHYGLAIGKPEVIEFLDKIFEEFIKIPEFQYSQIKLKYGYARFYCTLNGAVENMVEYKINQLVKEHDNSN